MGANSEIINLDISAEELVSRLLSFEPSAKLSLLDSCGRTLGDSRFLIAGIYPTEDFELFCRTQAEAFSALNFLDEKLDFYQSCGDLPFGGGICLATLAYEFGMLFENLQPRQKEFSGFDEPSATFTFYETLVVHDYAAKKSFIVGKQAREFAKAIKSRNPIVSDGANFSRREQHQQVSSNFTKSEYLAAVEKIRRHIALGNIYQANLTQRLRAELSEDLKPEDIFIRLRQNHPAPFAAFVRRKNDCVVSASPERFLQIQNPKSKIQNQKIVVASPIKGTRKRGGTFEEDSRLRRELETSAKDRAENVMIVDLLRNDIGRVCEFGSVKPVELCEIEEHASLFHLVSTIQGKMKNDAKMSDLLKATFPCGSITGAPKIRAMQILDEIETAPRNLSMGAIGYFAFDGTADLNVAIRTMTIKNKTAVFNVGGGIVFDSEAEAEYEESLVKARALLVALNASSNIK